MGTIRRRRLSVRLFAATMIVALVGPGPATAWANAREAERAADARMDEWIRSITEGDDVESSPAPAGARAQASSPLAVARRWAASADEILPVPLQPKNVQLLSSHSDADPWALFDGRATTALKLESSAPVRLAVDLQEPQALAAVTLLGPSAGALTVFAQEGAELRPISGLTGVRVHGAAGEWRRLAVEDRALVSRLVIEWVPDSVQGPLELGLWGRSLPVRDATDTELADRILASSAPGALVVKSTPELVTASRVSLGAGVPAQAHDGVVHLQMSAEPRSWSRAFLVYELTGLGHFTQAIRQINGLTPQGGVGAPQGAQDQPEGGLQVEEISPEWLRPGDNEIRFLPLPDAGAAEYSVRRVRVVGMGHATLAEARMSDISTSNGRTTTPLITFDRASQPHDLVFELLDRSEGRLLVRAAGTNGRPLHVDLHGLEKGWHRADLGALPSTLGVGVALDRVAGGGRALTEGHLPAVSEVAVTASAVPSSADAQRIGVSYPLHGECRNHEALVSGFVAAEHGDAVVALRANGEDVTSAVAADNSFALRLPEPRAKATRAWSVQLEATLSSGRNVKRAVKLEPCGEDKTATGDSKGVDDGAPFEQLVRAGEKKTLTFAGATLEIPAGAVERDVRISIRPLVAEQVPAMSARVRNASPGQRAYRFGPHGLKFKKPVKLTLPYDKDALEAGTSEQDLFSFYYDEQLASWQRVGRYSSARAGALVSLTEHFTDFITGVLATPDEPGLKSFNANEMKGIKIADPAAGVALIAPPSANSSGSMNLQYPLELPPGRNGIEPSLAFTYSSAGGNGWLGMGWNLPISAIEIDTRFGVPRYDDAFDRDDRYTLNGERLVPLPGASNAYVRRVEGQFDTIQRNLTTIGSKSCVTSWTVTDKRGTVYTYGGDGATLVQPGEPCNVSRWGLSKVKDTFGNRMNVTYCVDNGSSACGVASSSGGDAYVALYPKEIKYTAHDNGGGTPDLDAAYRVSFALDSNNERKDVVVSGRAGFQERTRFRLDHVDVELLNGAAPATLIRRYKLAYQAPALTHFYKSLLASIGQQGLGGVTELDRHTFDYGEAATIPGSSIIKGFGDPIPWGTASGSALSLVEDTMAGGSVTLGVGLPIVSLTVSGGANGGSETTKRSFLDLNGDGLPDLGTQSEASMNYLRPELSLSPPPAPGAPHLYPQSITGLGTLGHSKKSGWNVGGGINLAGVVGANVSYSSTSTDDDAALGDIDGDGLVDRASVVDGKLRWAKNKGNNAFELQPDVMNSSVLPNTVDPNGDFLGAASSSGQLARINPVVRWKAPFPPDTAGTTAPVTITGEIKKMLAGGNGVDVFIYKNGTPVWSRFVAASDVAPCRPKPMATPSLLLTGECDPASAGLPLTVKEGDSVYFMTTPHHDPNGPIDQVNQQSAGNRVSWDPQIGYDGMPSLLEPYGLPVYQFSQKVDHRLFRPEVQWIASADGTVHLQQRPWQPALPNKGSISDELTLTITHRLGSNGQVVGSPIVIAVPAGAATSAFPLDQVINVKKGDSVSIEATSDTPVDINQLGLDLWMVYSHYFRNLSSSTATYDGDVTCSKSGTDPVACVLIGDPEPDGQIPSDILAQPTHVSYRFNQLKGAATQALSTPSAQTFNLTGNVNCSGVTGATRALVQGVNQLYSKQAIPDDGMGTSTGSVSFNIPVTAQANGELMVTIFSASGCSGSASWNGMPVPINVKNVDLEFFALDPNQLPVDPMSGGFHRWSGGFANGDLGTFDPARIRFPLNASGQPTHTPTWFFFGVPQHEDTPPTDRPPGRWSGPGGAFIAAGQFNATRGSTRLSGGGSGGLDSIRHASTWNFELNASLFSVLGFGVNEGRTKSDLDLFDFNGDQYSDVVSADGTVQFGDGLGGLLPKTVSGIKDLDGLREIHHGTVRVTASLGDVQLINDVAADGTVRKSISTGFNFGTDYGLSSTTTDWIDVNGDGLPDAVQRSAQDAPNSDGNLSVRLNYGYRLGPATNWPARTWSVASAGAVPGLATLLPGVTLDASAITDLVNAVGAKVGINGVRMQDTASNNVNIGGSASTGGLSAGGGGGFSFGFSRTMVDMVDMNGDGLTDQVLRVAGENQASLPVLRVRLNLGNSFDTQETYWSNPNWGNIDDGGSDFSFAGPNAINDALGFRRSKSFTASFQFKICFFLCVGASAFEENGSGWAYSSFQDMDGDGRTDLVFKNKSSGQVTVKLNQMPKDLNLLKKVHRPLGGSFEVAYDRAGNLVRRELTPRIDEPANKVVMTQVDVADGRGNHYLHGFAYDPGYADRAERDDYGFAKVTTTRLNQNATPYSATEVSYNNQDFYRKRLASRVVVRGADARVFDVQSFSYAPSGHGTCPSPSPSRTVFPAETARKTSFFEGSATSPDAVAPVSTSQTRIWDCRGNLTEMTDSGDAVTGVMPANDIKYQIKYVALAPNIYKASEITAKDRFNKLLRSRTATYETHGALKTLTDVVVGGVDPITGLPNTGDPATNPKRTYGYDAYGNVNHVVDPRGYTVDYEFDPTTRTHRTLVQDSFGYASTSIPDLRFGGLASQTDVNGSMANFRYDEFGRLSWVDGPYDVGSSNHTISFSYSEVGSLVTSGTPPSNPQPAYAVTSHRDAQHPTQPILTSTFADGLGRLIQTKKTVAKDTGTGVTVGMQVSGAVAFDDQGRLKGSDQPYFESVVQPTVLGFQTSAPATRTTYDVVDRVTAMQTPLTSLGGDLYTWSTTTLAYGIGVLNGVNRRSVVSSDANVNARPSMPSLPGYQRSELLGVRGNVLQVTEQNRLAGSGPTTLKTSYGYNALEELLAVTDAKSNVTRATYDTLGRIVTLVSPDMGRTDFQFDLSGNLAAKQTANLVSNFQLIRYQYEFNRLTKINYPNSADVLFLYGSSSDAGPIGFNRAGRVKQETSEAGTKEFEYDALGNVNEETWTLNRIGPTTDPISRTFQYDYDSFGRLLAVYYPGTSAEVVSYGYDAGGKLDTVTGLTASRNRTEYVKHIGYNEFEQRTSLTIGNGISTTYSYDPLTHRPTGVQASQRDPALVAAGAPARPFQQLSFQYDPVGNITQIANTVPVDPTQAGTVKVGPVTENFSYDDLYQLKQADGLHKTNATTQYHYGLSFSYDTINNVSQKSQLSETQTLAGGSVTQTTKRVEQTYTSAYKYTGGRPHAPSEVSDTVPNSSTPVTRTLSYDANGNQSSWQRVTGTATKRKLTYDDGDRLSSVAHDNVELQSALYDGNGERLVKRANTSALTAYFGQYLTVRDSTPATKHIFAGDTHIASKFVPNPTNEECPACVDHASVTYFHGDHLGSISFATDEKQVLLAHEQYFPSGELWVDQSSDAAHTQQPYLFTGKELDAETGLYYFGARYYDPRIGVWTTPDPILAQYMRGQGNGGVYLPANLNSYGYSWNNPVTLKDSDGLMPQAALGALIGFGVELGMQWYTGEYNVTRLAIATGAGALSGGVSAFVARRVVGSAAAAIGTRIAANTIANSGIGAFQEASNQAWAGAPRSDDAITHAAFVGAAGGFLGSSLGEVVDSSIGAAARSRAYDSLSAGEKNLLSGVARTTAAATPKRVQPTITTAADVVANGTGPLYSANDTLNGSSTASSGTSGGTPPVTAAPPSDAPRRSASREERKAQREFYRLYGDRPKGTPPAPR